MTTTRPRLLVGCDGSPESEAALDWAVHYAGETGGDVTAVSAWQWPTFQDAPITYGRWDPEESCEQTLARLRAKFPLPDGRMTTVVARGAPARVLTDRSSHADLLVVGTHGLGALSRLLLGSVSAYCATHSHCPVAVVRAGDSTGRRGVLVGLDNSASSAAALRWAMDYAELLHQPLVVVHATEPPAPPIPSGYPVDFSYPRAAVHRQIRRWMRDVIDKELADRGRDLASGITLHVVDGNPAHVMVEQSSGAVLTVCGRRGAGGFSRLVLGSVTAALAHHGHSTIVVTPPA
jgi:nucleotide-binding universal stress UspA family protein